MNLAQRVVLILGFLVVLGLVLFPPWNYVFDPPADLRHHLVRAERPAGYHLLFTDHSPQDQSRLLTIFNLTPEPWEQPYLTLLVFSVQLDAGRLTVQLTAAVLLVAMLYLALHSSQKPPAH